MKENSRREIKEEKLTLKKFVFRFFHLTNQFQCIGRTEAILLISVTFFQLFFLIEKLIQKNNDVIKITDTIFTFDIFRIICEFSLIVPIIEEEDNVFPTFYNICLGFIYFMNFLLIVCFIYVFICIFRKKEVSFSFTLGYISSIFLLIQWVIYIPSIYILLYPFIGKFKDKLSPAFSGIYITVINYFLIIFNIFLGIIISILNNDSINRYDNALCRKNSDIEKLLFLMRTILFFNYVLNDYLNLAISNAFCIYVIAMMILLIYKQIKFKYYNDDTIYKLFASLCLCFIVKALEKVFEILIKFNCFTYNITIFISFVINYRVFSFLLVRMRTNILKKNIGLIKNIEEMILYMDILEEEAYKSLIHDPISCTYMTGYIINHMKTCTNYNCVLNQIELFLPSTNRHIEVPMNVKEMCLNEVVIIHLLKEIYIELADKFSGNIKYHFAYTIFLIFRLGNSNLALLEIEKSRQFSNTPQEELTLYLIKQLANDRLLNNQYYLANYANENISIPDIIDIIVFDILADDFEKGIEECARMKINFWSALREHKIYIEDVYIKGKNYINKKIYVSKIFNKITDISKSNEKINITFRVYNEIICDDFSIVESDQKKHNNDLFRLDLVHARFFDDTGFIIIDSSIHNTIGNINSYNKAICKLLKFDSEELIGKNLSIIQSDSIAKVHNKMILNFIKTGKNCMIGKNTAIFAKDKFKFIVPINLLIIPLPSYTFRSEILGILRDRKTEGSFIIINEYGLVETYSRELLKYDENLNPTELKGIKFFIFYIFPELFFTNDIDITNARKPTFLDERKMFVLTNLNAYFDKEMVKILQILENESNSNLENESRIKKKKESKVINEIKHKAYADYKRVCMSIRDYCKNTKEYRKNLEKRKFNIRNSSIDLESPKRLINNEDLKSKKVSNSYKSLISKIIDHNKSTIDPHRTNSLNHGNNITKDFTECYDSYSNFRKLFDAEIESDKNSSVRNLIKKPLGVKISPYHFNYGSKQGKFYILEFNQPLNDIDNFMGLDLLTEREDKELIPEEENGFTDDSASVSTGGSNLSVSINSIVTRLREQNNKNDNFNRSSYMNWLLYLLVLIISVFIVYFITYIWSYTNQQNILTNCLINLNKMKETLFYLRKLTYIKNLTLNSNYTLPLEEISSLDQDLVSNVVNLTNLNKNSTIILLSLTDKNYVDQLMSIVYPLDGVNKILSDVIDILTISSINIVVSVNKLTNNNYLSNLNLTQSNLMLKSNITNNYINFVISNTNNVIQSIISNKIEIISQEFKQKNDLTLNILYISYIILSSVMIIIMLLIFMILKERYNYNKTILEFLKQIVNSEIDEIIFKIDQFLRLFKTTNASTISDMTFVSKPTASDDLKTKEKTIIRKENIFLSFFFHISLIIILIIIYLILLYFFSFIYIEEYNRLYSFDEIIYDSYLNNIKTLHNLRDIYISNNTALYDTNSKVIKYIHSTYNTTKSSNDLVFSRYSIEMFNHSSKIQNSFDLVFYSDLCSASSPVNLNCTKDDKPIFYKGLTYALTYYCYQLEMILQIFSPFDIKDLFMFYLNNSNYFVGPSELAENKLRIIYNYLTSSIEGQIYKLSSLFFLIVLLISCISIFFIYLSIYFKWDKYANKIKLEEYMSNKIIAEIPMNIISKNRNIREHLLEFANNQ